MNQSIDKKSVEEIFELNPSQKGILFHYLQDEDSNVYNVRLSFRVEGVLSIPQLENALAELVRQNEVLRSVFRWERISKPVQIILKEAKISLKVHRLPDGAEEAELDLAIRNIGDKRFDLTSLPLRMDLFTLSDHYSVLNITYHQILLDGWSNSILFRELFGFYREIKNSRPFSVMRKPGFKSAYHALKEKLSENTTYWKQYLAGQELSTLLAQNHADDFPQKTSKFRLSTPLEGLDQFARKNEVNKTAIIYAAYGLTLSKYMNVPDVVFGTAVANRDAKLAGMDQVMGNFMNTIPCRLDLSDDLSLRDVVAKVNQDLIERNAHHGTSYYTIKKLLELKPQEDLYDCVLAIENYPIDENAEAEKAGIQVQFRDAFEVTNIPLLTTVFLHKELVLECTFDEHRIDPAYISSFTHRFLHIINALLESQDMKLSDLSLLTDGEKTQLVKQAQGAETPKPSGSLVSHFQKVVAENGTKIAYEDRTDKLNYEALNTESNRLAHAMKELGIGNGDCVGVMLPRNKSLICSLLAVLKTGAAYIPIDPNYPEKRISQILDDSGLALLVSNDHPADSSIPVLNPGRVEVTNSGDLSTVIEAKDLAYLIYTSGSTGKPKGIMVEHGNVLNFIKGIEEAVKFPENGSLLCLTTVSFDIFVTETFLPLLLGRTMVMASEEDQKDPDLLTQLISDHEVTAMQLTPSHLKFLVNNQENDLFGKLKVLMVGGEAFSDILLKETREVFKGRIYNMYGPTETTVWSSVADLTDADHVHIGTPIINTGLFVLDEHNALVPQGVAGQLCISGYGLARGYWQSKKLTDERFIQNPFNPNELIYRTGDLAIRNEGGEIKVLGRLDHQLKIRGFRIEPGEIEGHLLSHESIKGVVVKAVKWQNETVLVAYYVSQNSMDTQQLKSLLIDAVPGYMMPSYFVHLEEFPLTPNRKIDHNALPLPNDTSEEAPIISSDQVSRQITALWAQVLGHEKIGPNSNFFDVGGDSLKLVSLRSLLRKTFDRKLSVNDLFAHPSISKQADFIRTDGKLIKKPTENKKRKSDEIEIAIIGMAGRFPESPDLEVFWKNLRNGKEMISREASEGKLIKAKGMLHDYDRFDAEFFGYTSAEAEMMDPQMRIFHETVYHALEDAGYNPYQYEGAIGLYGGATISPFYNVPIAETSNEDWIEKWDEITYSDKDFLCPRVSYKLDLKGPSVNLSTACSTSLVAVDKACNDLVAGKCDVAVAGGISVTTYDNNGYFYHQDMIMSPDGRCRAFDENSGGTVGGNGSGAVVLKRLSEALKDNDPIYAVIKGSAINNDGSDKVGFTAPSISGQSQAIESALQNAAVDPQSISYIETHGTGTALGDPIEITALTKAFATDKKQYCAIGSVKTNIGHLDAAAGIAGLIKTILALKNKQIPASLHFTSPNPNIEFASSPFFVNNSLQDWKRNGLPRRAGVSSFGIGGTNAHLVLEEAPEPAESTDSRKYHTLLISGNSSEALLRNTQNLIDFLADSDDLKIADIAYSSQIGRAHFAYRKIIVGDSKEQCVDLLKQTLEKRIPKPLDPRRKQQVFMFPGQGSQYTQMSRNLYEHEPLFKEAMDECLNIYEQHTGSSLVQKSFSENPSDLEDIQFSHPSLFAVEYSLAKMVMHWGVKPDVLIGHSIGEYVAACIAGVFSLEDAMRLVIERSRLIQGTQKGMMLGVSISKEEIKLRLKGAQDIDLAAINSSDICVVSGSSDNIESFQKELEKEGYPCQKVLSSHASHSRLMDEILDPFAAIISEVQMKPPSIPFISNITGKKHKTSEVTDPSYWVRHLRHTVDFAQGIESIVEGGESIFIEMGPGNVLGTFVRSNTLIGKGHRVVYTIRHAQKVDDDRRYLVEAMGKMWLLGMELDWKKYYDSEVRTRVRLPGYSFEKKYFKVKTKSDVQGEGQAVSRAFISPTLTQWLHEPTWEISSRVSSELRGNTKTLVFLDDHAVGEQVVSALEKNDSHVIPIARNNESGICEHTFNSETLDVDLQGVLGEVEAGDDLRVILLWGISEEESQIEDSTFVEDKLDRYFYDTMKLAKTLASSVHGQVEITSVTNYASHVLTNDSILPEKSTLLGVLKVIEKEFTNIKCRNIDCLSGPGHLIENSALLVEEIEATASRNIALRNGTRFEESMRALVLSKTEQAEDLFRQGGTYIITGGLGALGLYFAEKIAQEAPGTKLVLLGRRELPERKLWADYLQSESNKQNPLVPAIQKLQNIEKIGSVASYYQVDVTNAEELNTIFNKVREKGPINGVIHSAGVADYEGIIFNRTREGNEKVFAPKVYGTIALGEALTVDSLDFFVLFSSISSVLPIEGQAGYVAANLFLNAYARYHSVLSQLPTISIGWNAWREFGMSFEAAKLGEVDEISRENSITPDEGFEILKLALKQALPEVIVSKITFPELERLSQTEAHQIIEELLPESHENTGDLQSQMLQLWSQFFGENIDLDDDFFEIGGNSLKALTLIGRIQRVLGLELSIKDFFNYATVRTLVGFLNPENKVAFTAGKAISRVNDQPDYKLSSAQKRLYFLYEFERESLAYNMPNVFMLEGPLNVDLLADSFSVLIRRHESLRTRFHLEGAGDVRQLVLDNAEFSLEQYEASLDEVDEIVEKFVRPFDLSSAPLIRVGLVDITPKQHFLIVDMHHIITDGVSRDLLMQDFMALYCGETLPDLKLRYIDYTEWRQSEQHQELIKKQKVFWKNQFPVAPDPTELPLDFSRPAVQSFEGSVVEFELSGDLIKDLNKLANEVEGTLFMVLFAAFNVLIGKLSNSEDVVIGTSTSGRMHADIEPIIGLFVNSLALRNFPKAEMSFKDFVLSIKANTLSCFDNQDYPYEDLIDDLKGFRDASRSGLFDVMFIMQNTDEVTFSMPSLKISTHHLARKIAKFDLSLEAVEKENSLIFNFEYNTGLFRQETIEAFGQYFIRILEAITTKATVRLADIHLGSPQANAGNLTPALYRSWQSIHGAFEEFAESSGNTIAVFDDQPLTYAGLNRSSNQLAHFLITHHHIGQGDYVGLLLDRSEKLLVGILAVLKTGAAFVPIETNYPTSRKAAIIEDSKSRVVITDSIYMFALGDGYEGEIVAIDIQLDELEKQSVENVSVAVAPTDLAYVLYTSGSTGRPKGVMISHTALMNYVDWATDIYIKSDEATFPFYTSVSFDLTMTSIFVPLLSGNQIKIYRSEKDEFLLSRVLSDGDCNIIKLTPSHIRGLRAQGFENQEESKYVFIVGGEEFDTSLASELQGHYPNARIYNEYGPTEATIGCMIYGYNTEDTFSTVPLGQPISNVEIQLLDENMNPVVPGVIGEIYISGICLSNGYLNQPDLSEERFIAHPNLNNERLYKTGDLASWLPNGDLMYRGRSDDQVKVRGHRIELAEITRALQSYSGIHESVVVVTGSSKDSSLAAYYVAPNRLVSNELRNYLMEMLPSYMIPASFSEISAIPLTTNGKLDKSALPDPFQADSVYLQPRTLQETLLAEVWEQVLGIDRVGIQDNFFNIGGDSIKSIQISARARNAGYALSVNDIFTYQTIETLASHLRSLSYQIDQSEVVGKAQLTPIQTWFLDASLKHPQHFNQSVVLDFPERVSLSLVEEMFQKLQSHHDALRMVFHLENGEERQENLPALVPVRLEEYEIGLKLSSGEAYANQLQQDIDLEKGPLMRLGLFHSENKSYLLIIVHHLIMDGVSWRILLEDLDTLLRQKAEEKPLQLPLKTEPFLKWSEHLKTYLDSARHQGNMKYWHEKVTDFESTSLPHDHTADSNSRKSIQTATFKLKAEQTHLLLGPVHRAFHSQINEFLLTAFMKTVNETFGLQKLWIDMESHGREEVLSGVDVNRTLGWFTTVFPIEITFQEEGYLQCLKETKERLRRVPGNGIDYMLNTHFGENRSTSGKPRVSFNYLGEFNVDSTSGLFKVLEESLGSPISEDEERAYDWEVTGMMVSDELEISLGYSSEQFRSQTISAFIDQFKENLGLLIKLCIDQEEDQLTPSDLTYKSLTVEQLDEIQSARAIDDIYRLSPMQEGLLFHALNSPESQQYFEQMSLNIQGDLEMNIVEKSMNDLLERHRVLRSTFLHQGYDQSLQMVRRHVKIPFVYKDIRGEIVNGNEKGIITEYEEEDRKTGFDLAKDVLMRLTVLQTGKTEYRFIWSHHHILMDGWCMGIILNEFRQLYHGNAANRKSALSPSTHYSSYIQWLESRDDLTSASYWKDYLEGYQAPAGLPQKSLDPLSEFDQRTKLLDLGKNDSESLRKISRLNGVTVSTIIQSIWGLLISRYASNQDVVFGAVVSGRPPEVAGIETMIGLFINAIPVRINLKDCSSLVQLFKLVQNQALAGEKFHFQPLSETQSESVLGRDLLNHILVFENYPVAEEIENQVNSSTQADFNVRDVEVFEQTNYDLTVNIYLGNSLQIRFDYNANIYDAKVIDLAAKHFQILVESATDGIGKAGDVMLSDVHLMDPVTMKTFLREQQTSVRLIDRNQCFYELFEAQVQKTPARIAAGEEGESLTYEMLHKRVVKWSGELIDLGMKPGDHVSVVLPRGLAMLTGMLTILRCGGVYVPVDVEFPWERQRQMLSDSSSQIIIAHRKSSSDWDSVRGTVVFVEDLEALQETKEHELTRLSTESAAYMIYTSGTTGKPKGVLVHHLGMINHLIGMIDRLELSSEDVMAQTAGPCFDISIWQFLVCLLVGGRTEIILKESVLDASKLKNSLRKNQVSIFQSVPSLLTAFVDEMAGESDPSFPDLRWLIPTGEALNVSFVRKWYDLYPDISLLNAYGPAEASDDVTVYEVPYPVTGQVSIPIGTPLQNLHIYILDSSNELCPAGVRGEICVSGIGVGLGYWGDEEKTARSFVANPFWEELDQDADYRLMYKTGDMGYYQPDGDVVYSGRQDDQVKVRGARIELGEIQTKLSQHALIREAVVLVRSIGGTDYLVGYYVSEEEFSYSDLEGYLSIHLPNYMIPSYFMALESLPVTANGKLDKQGLPDPEIQEDDSYVAPSNDTEEQLVSLWAEVLNRDKDLISTHKSFFEIGGDSIKIMKLTSRINRTFDTNITIPDMFRYTSIAMQTKFLTSDIASDDNSEGEIIHEISEMQDALSLFKD